MYATCTRSIVPSKPGFFRTFAISCSAPQADHVPRFTPTRGTDLDTAGPATRSRSGSPAAVEELLANMNHGGRVAMLGLPKAPYPIDWGRVITHMLTLRGIYGREMFETWYLMQSMLASSEVFQDAVRGVITHRFPADRWEDAFAAARSGECGKVIMDWS